MVEIFGIEESYSSDIINVSQPKVKVFVFFLYFIGFLVIFQSLYIVIESFVAVPSIAVQTPILGLVAQPLTKEFDGFFKLTMFEQVHTHLIIGQGNLVT